MRARARAHTHTHTKYLVSSTDSVFSWHSRGILSHTQCVPISSAVFYVYYFGNKKIFLSSDNEPHICSTDSNNKKDPGLIKWKMRTQFLKLFSDLHVCIQVPMTHVVLNMHVYTCVCASTHTNKTIKIKQC